MSETPQSHDEWARVGEYLDRLAFENDRLEAELKLKRERRAMRANDYAVAEPEAPAQTAPVFDEARETVRYEARTATETAQGMHISYDALRRDLSGLMSDLNDFKSTRAGLESRLST
ncbi:MAG: hypothetical protein JNJ69_18875 [Leptospiraceae bacterium]|nr:hypothetical protein [Leptospiraceae bacterium]